MEDLNVPSSMEQKEANPALGDSAEALHVVGDGEVAGDVNTASVGVHQDGGEEDSFIQSQNSFTSSRQEEGEEGGQEEDHQDGFGMQHTEFLQGHLCALISESMNHFGLSLATFDQNAQKILDQQEELRNQSQEVQEQLRGEAQRLFSTTQNLFNGVANVLGSTAVLPQEQPPPTPVSENGEGMVHG